MNTASCTAARGCIWRRSQQACWQPACWWGWLWQRGGDRGEGANNAGGVSDEQTGNCGKDGGNVR